MKKELKQAVKHAMDGNIVDFKKNLSTVMDNKIDITKTEKRNDFLGIKPKEKKGDKKDVIDQGDN